MTSGILGAVITVTKKPTARPKSIKRFALYKTGQTLAEFLKAGGRLIDLNYDRHGAFVQLLNPENKSVITAKIKARDVKEPKVSTAKPAKAGKSDSKSYTLRRLKAPKTKKSTATKTRKSA